MLSLKNVCILGGMHGNELSGVHLIKKWQKNPTSVSRPSFNTRLCLANPEAVRLNRRYKDCDLNRQFSDENFQAEVTSTTPYEVRRAKEMKKLLGDGGEIGPCDVVLDLHNTTANVKVCLIHADPKDVLMRQMMHYIIEQLPPKTGFTLYTGRMPYSDSRTLAPSGIGIEIGPQPHSVLHADICLQQEKVVGHALDFLEKFCNGEVFQKTEMEVYEVQKIVHFPRDGSGNISAMIHSDLQDSDWKEISFSDPVFKKMDGETIYLKDVVADSDFSNKTLYPMFINEAAYYEKDIAFYLTTKSTVEVPELCQKM